MTLYNFLQIGFSHEFIKIICSKYLYLGCAMYEYKCFSKIEYDKQKNKSLSRAFSDIWVK